MFKESEDILKEALGTFSGEESVEEFELLCSIAATYQEMEQFQMSRFAINQAGCCWKNRTLIGRSMQFDFKWPIYHLGIWEVGASPW